jgi:excisionase family DNA binding protein
MRKTAAWLKKPENGALLVCRENLSNLTGTSHPFPTKNRLSNLETQDESKKLLSHKRILSILQFLIISFRFWVADYKRMEAQEKFLEVGSFMDKYFNTKELSEYLRVPEQTIRRWVLNNEIAFVRIHNLIRFRLSEIEKWVDNKRANPPALPESEKELFRGMETVSLTETVTSPEITDETGANE